MLCMFRENEACNFYFKSADDRILKKRRKNNLIKRPPRKDEWDMSPKL